MSGSNLSQLLDEIDNFTASSIYTDDINLNYQKSYSYDDPYEDVLGYKQTIPPETFIDNLFSIMQMFLDKSIDMKNGDLETKNLWDKLSKISYNAVKSFYFQGSDKSLENLKYDVKEIRPYLFNFIGDNSISKVRTLYTTDIESLNLLKKLENLDYPNVDTIVPIANGGNEFGYIVANILDIPHDNIIPIRYSRLKAGDERVYLPRIFSDKINGLDSVLVVDDVSFTGKSLNKVKSFLSKRNINAENSLVILKLI